MIICVLCNYSSERLSRIFALGEVVYAYDIGSFFSWKVVANGIYARVCFHKTNVATFRKHVSFVKGKRVRKKRIKKLSMVKFASFV